MEHKYIQSLVEEALSLGNMTLHFTNQKIASYFNKEPTFSSSTLNVKGANF